MPSLNKAASDYKKGQRCGKRCANVAGIRTKSFWKGYREAMIKKMSGLMIDSVEDKMGTQWATAMRKKLKRMNEIRKKQTSDGRTYWTL